MKKLAKLIILLFICFAFVSCNSNSAEDINSSIKTAISTLDAVTTASEDVVLTLSGSTNQREMLMFKEALLALDFKKIGDGFVCIDMFDLYGITSLDTSYFSNMTILKSVILPQTLREVPKYMFDGCTKIEEIVIPEKITYAGFCAFENCSMLKNIRIDSDVFELGAYAFNSANENLKIICPDTAKLYFLAGGPFDIPHLNAVYNYLPVDSYLDVTKTVITKSGNEKTLNLSIKYSSDSDLIFFNEKDKQGFRKVVGYLKGEDTTIETSESGIDGILAWAIYKKNQKITITSPTDGSLWYYTKYQDEFYSRKGGTIVDFSNGNIEINSANQRYYYRIAGEEK